LSGRVRSARSALIDALETVGLVNLGTSVVIGIRRPRRPWIRPARGCLLGVRIVEMHRAASATGKHQDENQQNVSHQTFLQVPQLDTAGGVAVEAGDSRMNYRERVR